MGKLIENWMLPVLSTMIAACSSGSGPNQQPSTSTGDAGGSGLDAGGPPGLPQLQMAMSAIDIAAGAEVYKCQDFDNPFGKDIAIVSSESIMSPGSHHFAAFRIAGLTAGPMIDCPSGGLEAHEFIHAAHQVDQITSYPPNVRRFLAGTPTKVALHGDGWGPRCESLRRRPQARQHRPSRGVRGSLWLRLRRRQQRVGSASRFAGSTRPIANRIARSSPAIAKSRSNRDGSRQSRLSFCHPRHSFTVAKRCASTFRESGCGRETLSSGRFPRTTAQAPVATWSSTWAARTMRISSSR
jgi:hypothetical protein